MPYKRKRYGRRRRSFRRKSYRRKFKSQRRINSFVRRFRTMIETKEGTMQIPPNVSLLHNQVYVVQATVGGDWNPFYRINNAGDPMSTAIQMIGDKMTVKGVSIKLFMENALQRPRVYYRIMVLRGAKGDTFNRSTIFKGDCNNKMIDQVNVERFRILAQKIFTINASNTAASGVSIVNGAPTESTNPPNGGVGTKIVKLWIPGRKFGKYGNVHYENQSAAQVKFYDYRMVILAYDWFGTPQDLNYVGDINEGYTKLYFQDV